MTFRCQAILTCLWLRIPFQPRYVSLSTACHSVGRRSFNPLQRVVGPGTVLEPLIVAPAISISIMPQAGIVPLGTKSFEVTVNLHSNVKGPAKGTVKLDLPEGWKGAAGGILNFEGRRRSIAQLPRHSRRSKRKGLRHYRRRHLRWP